MKMKFHEYIFLLNKEMEDSVIDEFLTRRFDEYFIDYQVDEKLITLKFYMSYINPDEDLLKAIMEKFNLEILSHKVVEEKNWLKVWLDTLSPFEFIEGVWVNPFPEKKLKKPIVINIVPGTAFGTGLHNTTKLAGKMLQKTNCLKKDILDVGCGTGILSILSKKFGANKVLGVDYDPLAVEKAHETLEINDVDIEIKQSDYLSNVEGKFDILVSNMVAEILMGLLKDKKFDSILKDNSFVILTGIMKEKEQMVKDEAKKHNLYPVERMEEDIWVGLKFQKKI